jgi:hypothetical protein
MLKFLPLKKLKFTSDMLRFYEKKLFAHFRLDRYMKDEKLYLYGKRDTCLVKLSCLKILSIIF